MTLPVSQILCFNKQQDDSAQQTEWMSERMITV